MSKVNVYRPMLKRETTDADIRTLRDEAASHGDTEMVALCERALKGNAAALLKVQGALLDADAQREAN